MPAETEHTLAMNQAAQTAADLADAYYTPADVAKILRVKLDTLAMWRRKLVANKPPFVALSRKAVLYPRAEFNAWIGRQKIIYPDAA